VSRVGTVYSLLGNPSARRRAFAALGFFRMALLPFGGAAACGRFQDLGFLPMKPDIHPQYHLIKVVMTDGTEFVTRSTYGEDGATLNLDIDPKTHPAWTGGSQQLLDRGGRLSRFNSRFGNMSFGTKK
jgi:large subunit ribosomal protein L31